jgi:predicted permease
VITFGVSPALNGYKPPAAARFFEGLEDALAALPGVGAVAAARVPLLSGDNWGNTLKVQGFQAGPDTDTNARYNEVSPAYFSTLGTPMAAGRDFTRADASGTAKVAIVNEAFLKKFSLGREAIGKRIGEGSAKEPDIEIVGIAQNAKYSKVKDEVPPVYFRPYRQADQTGAMHFYVRTSLDPERMLAAVPKVVAMLDANLPVEDLRTMTEQANDNIVEDRFVSVLSASFALLATLLAAIGLYGVLAYTVAQRTREIGVRMALGAAPERVRAMILGQLGRMAVVGIVIGVGAAIGLGRLAQSMLYKLQGYDPLVLTGAVAMLAGVTFAAGYIPALRASRVDPMRALRYE